MQLWERRVVQADVHHTWHVPFPVVVCEFALRLGYLREIGGIRDAITPVALAVTWPRERSIPLYIDRA